MGKPGKHGRKRRISNNAKTSDSAKLAFFSTFANSELDSPDSYLLFLCRSAPIYFTFLHYCYTIILHY